MTRILSEEEIFQAAIEMAGAERAKFLATACAGQSDLLDRVSKLLAFHDEEGFMQRPADRTASDGLKKELARLRPEEGEDRIGNYKLFQKIGEGGFGAVWMAEQQEPVQRRVALKIIKLGMDTKSVIARFREERQALAMMDHPNIAKVFDAGTTETGRPFFVMELVRGIKITEYCDQNHLSTSQRLGMFVQVCHAIQHAHQKGIIHRDIKPSNILVTLHDGVPVPKVIDFGIAKATTGQRLTDATLFTAFEQFLGTPAYMSPEQAELSGLDIDTRSDIYSLGVLLYELLTGQTPFDGRHLLAAGLDEMRSIIRDKEPLRPSTRLTRELVAPRPAAEGLAIPSDAEVDADARRRLRLMEQISRLRGDLDWIVMKCLEKDRARRYDTANDLASDLVRHLENEPVLARPPSAVYKLQKAWRRNRLALTAAGGVAVALILGISVSLWQAFEARRAGDAEKSQRLVAQKERDKAQAAQAEAEAEKLAAQRHLYVANINLAARAWEQGNYGLLLKLLEDTRSFPQRGFEWRYWQRQAHLHLQIFRGHVGGVRSAAFSPDGLQVASCGMDHTARLWDANTGQETARFIGHRETVCSVVFSPDGKLLVTGSDDGAARVWSVKDHRALFVLKGHSSSISSVSFSPDGVQIATASADRTARLWDAKTGLEVSVLHGHTNALSSLAFSPDGKRLATASVDQTVRVWDLKGQAPPLVLEGHGVPVLSVAFSPDGQRVAAGSLDRVVRFWDAASGRELPLVLAGSGPICSVAYSRDGKAILTAGWDSVVKVWDPASGTNLIRILGHSRGAFSAAFSPDGERVITAGDDAPKMWASNGARESLAFRGKTRGSLAVAFSPDGRRAVAGGTFAVDETIEDGPNTDPGPQSADLWDTASGQRLASLVGHASGIASAAFSPDGRRIVTSSGDQTARVWDSETGQEIWKLSGHNGPVNAAVFSPDGQRMVTAGRDRSIKVWELAGRKLLFEMTGHAGSVTSVAYSQDGARIVSGSHDQTVRVWEAATGQPVFMLTAPTLGKILSVAFAPNGQTVAASGYAGMAMVWDVTTRDVICRMLSDNTPLGSVAFSPDGQRLATGGFSGIARVWDATTGWDLLTLDAYGRGGAAVAFSQDGNRIITGSVDLPARLWLAASPAEIAAWDAEELAATQSEKRWQEELAAQLRQAR